MSTHEQTLFVPKTGGTSFVERATTGLPPDLLNRAATRLEILAWLYAFTFFMAAFFPHFLIHGGWGMLAEHTMNWAPGVVSISVAAAVAIAIRRVRPRPSAVAALGLVFEIVSSYGIATAEFLTPMNISVRASWIGLSWVAVWVLLFNVVVPTMPLYAVVAALVSVTSVPAAVLLSISTLPPAVKPDALQIFVAFGLPYILVVIMAYVGVRVVYNLGTEVKRARDLGSYRLQDRLGEGGMGEVWRASHRLLARPAAIKLIRRSLQGNAAISENLRRRFEREAQVTAQLRSPHTVTLFDFGVAEDGAFYYVMELLDGVDANSLVRRFGPIPAERVVFILCQICHSLSEAESHGLVHRDIKPANIFLCRYGEDLDFVKVLDFGIAKAVHDTTSSGAAPTVTIPNVIHGSPAFIAPEQALGSDDVDTRADIYSTGCVAYWLLTGELVFTAETTMKLLLAHAHTLPQPPSSRTEMPIPADLEALVLSCLEKDPANRPQSARDLRARLDAIAVREPWTGERAREWWRVHLPQPNDSHSS